MKMEVLSVQNQFQGQFGMIGSTKVKDWTSPLTSPLPAHHRHNHHHRNHYHHHQNNRHHHSNTHYSSSGGGNNAAAKSTSLGGGGGAAAAATTVVVPPTATEAVNGDGVVGANNNQGIDLVDGYTPRIDGHYHGPHATTTEQQQQQHHQHNNHHRHNQQYYHHYHHDYHQNQHSYHHHNQTIPAALATSAAAAAAATSAFALRSWKNNDSAAAAVAAAAIDDDTVAVDASNIVDQQQSLLHSSSSLSSYTPPSTPPPSPHHYNISRYSSNLICYGGGANITGGGVGVDVIDAAAINELSIRLQSELRAAKSRHLACTEVSLPWDLTPRIAAEIIRLSEKEPCGIRGCTIYIEFEDEPSNTRRIASLKIDPNTVSTFELYLTLKHDKSGWTSLLPQFIKNLTRSSTILISPDFSLTKNKLYHNSSE